MRRIILLGLTIASFVGCSLEDALENAPCESDDDCTGSQECVQTEHQASVGELGWCRSDGKCAPGEQEGCLATGDSCGTSYTLYPVMASNGSSYCCETGGASDATATPSADGSSARCVVCPSDLCYEQGDATEPCSVGDSRCVEVSNGCGCRVPADQIENSECEDDATCGEGFVCVRTLEQATESQETLPEDQMQEPGWCRTTNECASGLQEGCTTEGSCNSGQYQRCAGTRCYCCETPTNSTDFNVHVYDETELGESAACIECPRSECTTTDTCTALEDASCVISGGGPCGCLPEA